MTWEGMGEPGRNEGCLGQRRGDGEVRGQRRGGSQTLHFTLRIRIYVTERMVEQAPGSAPPQQVSIQLCLCFSLGS